MITGILRSVIGLYMIIIVVHALMSWFPGMRGRPFELWLRMLVEPAEKPIRQFLQPIQANIGIDFSPAVLLIILSLLQGFL